MKQMPAIQKFMTMMPHTIGQDQSIKTAISLMREHQIRHLPVQNGGELVGIVTDRDVKLASSLAEAQNLTVADVMTPDPYTVAPETSLDHVVLEMAEHKYGSAIIRQQNGKIVGIFTAVDGLRVLGEELAAFYKPAK